MLPLHIELSMLFHRHLRCCFSCLYDLCRPMRCQLYRMMHGNMCLMLLPCRCHLCCMPTYHLSCLLRCHLCHVLRSYLCHLLLCCHMCRLCRLCGLLRSQLLHPLHRQM